MNPIPNKLHQIWIGPRPLDPQHSAWIDRWRELHPAWRHQVWSEDACLDVIHGYGGECPRIYSQAISWATRADLARYLILLQEGGVYADVDYRPLKPIDSLLIDCEAFVCVANGSGHVGNSLMGARAGHSYLKEILSLLPKWFQPRRTNSIGPPLVDHVVRRRGDVRTFEQRLFCPIEYADREHLGHQEAFPDSYAVHYFAKNW